MLKTVKIESVGSKWVIKGALCSFGQEMQIQNLSKCLQDLKQPHEYVFPFSHENKKEFV